MKKIEYSAPKFDVTRFGINENILEQTTPGDGDVVEIGTTRDYISQMNDFAIDQ